MEKIRIFIGTEPKTNIPLKVLKYSILKHTKSEIEFNELGGHSWKYTKQAPLQIGTGFSLHRWYIPELCDYQGNAIYLDVDMLVFVDIAELFHINLQNGSVACCYTKNKWYEKAPATSCMLISCQKAKQQWQYYTEKQIIELLQVDEKRKKYVALMHAQYVTPQPLEIDPLWNCFNNRKPGCKILHYTKEDQQPWYYPENKEKNIWRDYFLECLKAGLISKAECEFEIKRFQPHTSCCRGEGLHKYWSKFLVHAKN